MVRLRVCALAVVCLGATAFAQRDLSQRLRSKGPVKNAGIYHYGLGTWTRPGALGSDLATNYNVIYNNTCESQFFVATYTGELYTDEGRIPGSKSPDKIFNQDQLSVPFVGAVDECPTGPSAAVGSARGSAGGGGGYDIDAFQIGYCSNFVGPTTAINLQFRETTLLDDLRCAQAPHLMPTPTASFALTSFPGDAGGPFGCWIVTLDLASASLSFPMKADGNGNYASPTRSSELAHAFSWTFSFPGTPDPTASGGSGFFVAGVPTDAAHFGWTGTSACSGYDGTVWDRQAANAAPLFPANGASGSLAAVSGPTGEAGTGMSTQDAVRLDLLPLPTPVSGCYFFGGPGINVDFASFHLELYTQDATTPVLAPGTGFCYGDGCTFNCGCVTPNTVPLTQGHHESGCANGFDLGGATLVVTGATAPAPGTVSFSAFIGTNYASFAFLLKGNAQNPNGDFAASDGIKCVSGATLRFGAHNAGTNGVGLGSWTYPNTAQTTPVSAATLQGPAQLAYYQLFYRHNFANFCTTFGTNFSNGLIIRWP